MVVDDANDDNGANAHRRQGQPRANNPKNHRSILADHNEYGLKNSLVADLHTASPVRLCRDVHGGDP
ncbi:MAG: hypothetical protein QOG53_3379 [Frankiales bacterium]|nr:hypothetical protein [Frankiales bacterium]